MNEFSFEPLESKDLSLLHQWLQEPHVMKFWDDGDRTLEDVKRHYERKEVAAWIGCREETPCAYLQIASITENHSLKTWQSKRYKTFGFDFFIGNPTFIGKGLAVPLVESFIQQVIQDYLPCRLLVDPETRNIKAMKIYQKTGFKQVGEFLQQGKSYAILKKDMSNQSVQIVSYNPEWAQIFEAESKLLQQSLGKNCLSIYHFGSTSVPGLSAKPKIDILAVVNDFSSLDFSSLLKLGYEVRGQVIPSGRYFVKESPPIHLHIFEKENPLIEKNLMFRDWLRTHPEDLTNYAELKETLAFQFNEHNGMACSEAKTEFIEKIIKKARRQA